jgi:hypothetical protein
VRGPEKYITACIADRSEGYIGIYIYI